MGEHSDYGLLAILKQDDLGGLQVMIKSGWIDAPPIASQVDSIGLDVSTHLPRRVTREELVGAVSVVCDVSDLAPPEVRSIDGMTAPSQLEFDGSTRCHS